MDILPVSFEKMQRKTMPHGAYRTFDKSPIMALRPKDNSLVKIANVIVQTCCAQFEIATNHTAALAREAIRTFTCAFKVQPILKMYI